MQISSEEMTAYRVSARRRQLSAQEEIAARYSRAWQVARQAAHILREQFAAAKVAVFGSLVHKELFHMRSDVDLAAWGMDEKGLYRAVGQLLSLDPEITVDVVMAEQVSDSFLKRIEREGVTV
jgi:predicted nucleotidyltransferase